jgi:Tol biopolymer transport system component
MGSRLAVFLVLLCSLLAIVGCRGDDKSAVESATTALQTTTMTSTGAGELLDELQGWHLAFQGQRSADDEPGLFVANVGGTGFRRVDSLPRGDKQTPNWSPDGQKIAFRWSLADETNTMLAVIGADGRSFVNLSKVTGLRGWSPSWSPDGKQLVAAATPKAHEPPSLYVMNADGSSVHRITQRGREAQYPSWSPDGEWIAFTFVVDGGFDLFKIRPDGSDPTALTNDGTQGTNNWPMWSPDSAQIAYGREGVLWIMNADGSHKRLVTDDGGVPAAWAPGPYIAFGCSLPQDPAKQTLCAIRPDGSGVTSLLGNLDANAGFPGWRPRTN